MTTQPKAMRKSALTARLVPLQPLQRRQRKSVMTADERKEWKAEMLAAQEEAFENRMVNVWERVSLAISRPYSSFSLRSPYLMLLLPSFRLAISSSSLLVSIHSLYPFLTSSVSSHLPHHSMCVLRLDV